MGLGKEAPLSSLSAALYRGNKEVNRTTGDENGDNIYEVNLPPRSLKGRMPEIDYARDRYGTKRHSGTGYNPPSQQGHPAHRESSKFLVLRGG